MLACCVPGKLSIQVPSINDLSCNILPDDDAFDQDDDLISFLAKKLSAPGCRNILRMWTF
jgi:hypothetical protein